MITTQLHDHQSLYEGSTLAHSEYEGVVTSLLHSIQGEHTTRQRSKLRFPGKGRKGEH